MPPIFPPRTLQPPFFSVSRESAAGIRLNDLPEVSSQQFVFELCTRASKIYDWNGIRVFYLFTVRLNVRFYYATWLVFHWKGTLAPFIKNRLSIQMIKERAAVVCVCSKYSLEFYIWYKIHKRILITWNKYFNLKNVAAYK